MKTPSNSGARILKEGAPSILADLNVQLTKDSIIEPVPIRKASCNLRSGDALFLKYRHFAARESQEQHYPNPKLVRKGSFCL